MTKTIQAVIARNQAFRDVVEVLSEQGTPEARILRLVAWMQAEAEELGKQIDGWKGVQGDLNRAKAGMKL